MATKIVMMIRSVRNSFDVLRLRFQKKKKIRSRLYVVFRKPSSRSIMVRRPVETHFKVIAKQGSMAFVFFLFQMNCMFGQSVTYDNFDGSRSVVYGTRNGVLDSAVSNPLKNLIDSSNRCAMYIRNSTKKFDNIKMSLPGKLTGVEQYATYLGNPPQLKIKVYTTAPIGTLVEVLLGSKGRNNEYPAGTHSQYQAYTTTTNTWEELEFKFSQIPEGSETSAAQIDQITLLFNPNSSTSDTYYFDDLTGPIIVSDKSTVLTNPTDPVKKENKKQ